MASRFVFFFVASLRAPCRRIFGSTVVVDLCYAIVSFCIFGRVDMAGPIEPGWFQFVQRHFDGIVVSTDFSQRLCVVVW